MRHHDQITIARNRHRASELRRFRALVLDYFERSQRDPDDLPLDWEGAQVARSQINQMLPRIIQVVRAAGLDGWSAGPLQTDPGPALGRVEVLQRIFSGRYVEGVEQEVLDLLDMALGVYDGDQVVALIRTFSPFHYLGAALAFIARSPRAILAALGLRRARPARAPAADLDRLEASLARLANVEELIESQFAMLQERQAARHAENARQLAELGERLDFAERMLAQPRQAERLPAPERGKVVTPV